jgi:hypothetical protein
MIWMLPTEPAGPIGGGYGQGERNYNGSENIMIGATGELATGAIVGGPDEQATGIIPSLPFFLRPKLKPGIGAYPSAMQLDDSFRLYRAYHQHECPC